MSNPFSFALCTKRTPATKHNELIIVIKNRCNCNRLAKRIRRANSPCIIAEYFGLGMSWTGAANDKYSIFMLYLFFNFIE